MTAKPRRKTSQAPKGRNNPAQGNALRNASPEGQSPEPERSRDRSPTGDRAAVNEVNQRAGQGNGWTVVKSGELFTFLTSGSRGWAKYYSETGPAFLRVGNLDHDSISLDLGDVQRVQPPSGAEGLRTRVQPGDILISITADVGMVGLVPDSFEEAYINQHVALARPNGVFPPYLAWFLSSRVAQKQFRDLQRGATKVGLGLDDIRSIDVPVPPLDDQRRIVAEIEKQFTRLEAGVAALRRVQANLKRYRAAVLKAACEGRLVPTEADLARVEGRPFESGQQLLARILTERRQNWQGRGKYKEPASLSASGDEPDVLPQGWAWASVEQVTSLVTSGSRGWGEFYSDVGPLFIRAQDIKTDSLKLSGVARVALPENAEGMRSSVENSDLLITITGANVTKSAIVRGLTETAFVSQHVALLKPVCREAASFHFLWLLSPAHGRKHLEKWAYGAGKPGLSLEQVRSLPVAVPPLAEQTRIVAEVERRLSVVEELETVATTNLERATRLRQSIPQKAFTGKLIVSQQH